MMQGGSADVNYSLWSIWHLCGSCAT